MKNSAPTQEALNFVFKQIETGSVEQAAQLFNETYRMGEVLVKDIRDGNVSKIASDTMSNVANSASSIAPTLGKMLVTGAFDLFTGNFGKLASDTAVNITNAGSSILNAATGTYSIIDATNTLRKAKISGIFRAGILEKLANTSPEKLNALVGALIKNPLFLKTKESLRMEDESLSKLMESSITLIKDLSPESRERVGESIAAFLDADAETKTSKRIDMMEAFFSGVKELPKHKRDLFIEEMLENSSLSNIEFLRGIENKDLQEQIRSSFDYLEVVSPQSRRVFFESVANFMDAGDKVKAASSQENIENLNQKRKELTEAIFRVSTDSPEAKQRAVEMTGKLLTKILDHKQSGQNPPTDLDKVAKEISPYRQLIANLNTPETISLLLSKPEFKNLAKNLSSLVKIEQITLQMNKAEREAIIARRTSNTDEVLKAVGDLLKPDILLKILPSITGDALSGIPQLQSGSTDAENMKTFAKIPRFLQESKKEIISKKILTEAEFNQLLKSCEKLPVNSKLEEELGATKGLIQRVEILRRKAKPDIFSLLRKIVPGLQELAKNGSGLEALSKELLENKDRTIGALHAVVASPAGSSLRFYGLNAKNLFERIPSLLTQKSLESFAKFINEPSARTALSLAVNAKSLTLVCSCLKNAAINLGKKAILRAKDDSDVKEINSSGLKGPKHGRKRSASR